MILTSITNIDQSQLDLMVKEVDMNSLGVSPEEVLFLQKMSLLADKYGCKIKVLDLSTRYLGIWCPSESYSDCVAEMENFTFIETE